MNIKDSIKKLKPSFRKNKNVNSENFDSLVENNSNINENDKKPIPLTGGNVHQSIQQTTIADSLINIDGNYELPKFYDKNINYNDFLILNFHAEYFANYFKLHCEDYQTFLNIINVFKGYFYYGNVGMFIVNNKQIPVYEIKSNFNASGDKTSIEVGYLNELFSGDSSNIFNRPKNTFKITKDMMDDYIPLGGGMSAYIKWWPFSKLQSQVLNMVNDHRFFIHKVLAIKCKDSSALKKEIDAYYNLKLPFILNIGSTTDTNTNNFVDINQTESANDKVINYYENLTKIYYELLGRRKNTDFKKERNVSIEVEASQSNFDILLNNEKKVKQLFLKRLSEKINQNIYIIDEDNELKEDNDDIKELNSDK